MSVLRAAGTIAALAAAIGGLGACSPGRAGQPAGGHSSAAAGSRSAAERATPPAAGGTGATSPVSLTAGMPRPEHVVVVVMENRAYGQIVGNPAAPYLNELARTGASFSDSHAITHPSEPNYLALFSGSTHGLTDDSCPHSFAGDTLAQQLIGAGDSFAGYSEGLPYTGFAGCANGSYARKHAPWTDFPALPSSTNRPFSDFPLDYAHLSTVSFVIPDLDDDMHDGTIAEGDRWLRAALGGYVRWARSHDSLLVLTWDEDDGGGGNRIATIVAGDHVRVGVYPEHLTHYRLLRTIEALEGLPGIGAAAGTGPVSDIWTE